MVYFISFVLVGTMVMLNLFIGVIMNGMSEAQAEEADRREKERRLSGVPADVHGELMSLAQKLGELESSIKKVARRANRSRRNERSRMSAAPAE